MNWRSYAWCHTRQCGADIVCISWGRESDCCSVSYYTVHSSLYCASGSSLLWYELQDVSRAHRCMRLRTRVSGHRKRVCTESGLWEKNLLSQWGIKSALVTCQSDAIPTELHPCRPKKTYAETVTTLNTQHHNPQSSLNLETNKIHQQQNNPWKLERKILDSLRMSVRNKLLCTAYTFPPVHLTLMSDPCPW